MTQDEGQDCAAPATVLVPHDIFPIGNMTGFPTLKDRLTPLLEAPDADELLNWLRRQPLLQIDEEKKLVMAHAGITPQWDLQTAKECARDVEAASLTGLSPSVAQLSS